MTKNVSEKNNIEPDIKDQACEIGLLDLNQFNPRQFASCNLPEQDILKKN